MYKNIYGVVGNEKIGLSYEQMGVQTDGRQYRPACWHKNDDKRIEVCDVRLRLLTDLFH